MKALSFLLTFMLLFTLGCQVKSNEGGELVENHNNVEAKFTLSVTAKTYSENQNIDFKLTFPRIVQVTGTPNFNIAIGSDVRSATYLSGNGTKILTFRYLTQSGDNDTNGVTPANPIILNGGTLKYDGGLDCDLNMTIPVSTDVMVDTLGPIINVVTPPSPGTYTPGLHLNFTANFSEKVVVTGTPRIPLTIGSTTRYATYHSGSGTENLIFRYTPISADFDSDGIQSSPMNLNGGTIKDLAGNIANISHATPNTSQVYLPGTIPIITSVTAPTNGKYSTGQNLNFTVNFNQPVVVTAVPRLNITLESGAVTANYVSGGGTSSLIFRYTVQAGQFDSNGLALVSPVNLNGGSIQNVALTQNANLSFLAPNTSAVLVDGIDPVITAMAGPANGSYNTGDQLNFTATYSAPVTVTGTPRFPLTIGASNVYANYVSGSGTSNIVFRYTVLSGESDADGIQSFSPIALNGGTIKDAFGDNAGLTFTPPNTSGVLVDGVAPTILSVLPPANATYTIGQTLNFTVNTSEPVTVVGSPRIQVTIGTDVKYLAYASGDGTDTLVFSYTVVSGDYDNNGVLLASPLLLNGGLITDTAGNNLTLSFTLPNSSGVLVDGLNVEISSVIPPANATYLTTQNLDFTVNFTQTVNVTGTPRLTLDLGGQTAYATYVSGTGSSALLFRYTVVAGDQDTDGIAVSSPIDLNGGTIQSIANSNADVTFTPPNTTGVLVDGIDLVIQALTPPADGTYLYNQNLDFTVEYNYPALVTGSPRITLTVGGTTAYATYLSGSGTDNLIFRYTVAATDEDTDGIDTVGATLDLNGGSIKDAFGDNADITITAANYPGVLVDGIVPTISSVAGPGPGTFYEDDNIDFTVTFSESVNIVGSPRIALTIGSSTKYATYTSGSGTPVANFRYTVVSGDVDNDGIASSSPLDLNSGTIKDLAGNDLNPLTFTPPNTALTYVDANNASILSITPPANGKYNTGANLDFTANFSRSVTITGTPRIALTVGSSTLYADYLSGSGTASIVFRYTVLAGEKDADGIALTSPVDLNGGTIIDSSLNNASLIFSPPNTSGIRVDGINLEIASITPPADDTYLLGENLDFVVNYNYAATVSGSPQLPLTIGGASRNAVYLSGSGTTALTFRYTVAATDVDTDGIDSVGPGLDLNGGTIQDEFLDNALIAFTGVNYPGILVDGDVPSLISVTAPAASTYYEDDLLDFTATFDQAVTVSGSPRIALTIGSNTRYATYQSGSGTTSVIFRYIVVAGDTDYDGITVTSPVDLNSGTITDVPGNAPSSLTFTPPDTSGVNVDANNATIITVTPPANATYKTGNNVDFSFQFSRSVTVTGSPRLALTVGATSVYANYLSGSGSDTLVFRYTVLAGDKDTDGIATSSPLDLNSGTIVDSSSANAALTFTVPNTTSVLVDGIDLEIASVTPPADDTYILGENLDFTVTYNYAATVTGSPQIVLTVGAATRYATYQSGSGTTALTFRYTVGAGDLDSDGLDTVGPNLNLNGGTIQDEFGDNALIAFTDANYPNKKVEGVVPSLISVSAPAAGTYYEDDLLDFTATFDEAVTITGSPRIALTIGSTTKYAIYQGGSGSTSVVFRYTVVAGDTDYDGIAVSSPVDLNSGTITDVPGNAPSSLTFTPPDTSGVNVDANNASIIAVTPPANATYKTGNNVDFSFQFSRSVTVTGSPRLALTIGAASVYADYLSGSGSDTLVFRYTVIAGDKDTDGIAASSPLDLNGGTIVDGGSANAILTFSVPNTSSVLVDGIDLEIASITPPADDTYILGENLDFTVNYNYAAIVTGSPQIELTVGAATRYATYLSGSGSTALTFRYTVGAGELDNDGIDSVGPNLNLNGGTIQDEFGDNALIAFTAANYPNKKVEGVVPTISSITAPADGEYYGGNNLDFVANFSEAVDVTGSPRITLTVGSSTLYATYLSGSGSDTLTFRYTVNPNDYDNDGIATVSPLDLNSGSIQDAAGNDLSPLTFTPPDTSNVDVDATTATIASITPPANATYKTGNNLDFTVNFSRIVNVSGSPRIPLTVGATTYYATYQSGSGSTTLNFRYTVAAGHLDNDGIAIISPMEANGGTIRDNATIDATLTFTAPDTSGVLVDGIDLLISSITPPVDDTYILGEDLDFVVNYNYAATVTGTPRIQLTVGASTLYASYLSGSGTTALTFRYTVGAGEVDGNGIDTVGPSLDLNSGSIADGFGDNADLAFTDGNLANVRIDGVAPTISSVGGPGPSTYYEGDYLDFVVTFSEFVNVTGTPRIAVTIGSTTVYANYAAGSGTSLLTFRYTVIPGDSDTDGIESSSPLELNSGTIADLNGNNVSSLVFTPPNTALAFVDANVAGIISVTPPADASYKTGNQMDFTVNFSRPVDVTGTPRLAMEVGSTTVYVDYVSGTGTAALLYRYTVQAGDNDLDGVSLTSPLELNGGTIIDSASNNANLVFTLPNTSNVDVDGIDLVITSVGPPADDTYLYGEQTSFTVNFNENAYVTNTPQITLNVGGATRHANYISGSGTTTLLFRYTVGSTDVDADGIETVGPAISGTIQDAHGDNADLSLTGTSYPLVLVEGTIPTISTVAGPSPGTYYESENLDFVATFTESIAVTGSPRIALTIGAATRYATYISGGGTSILTFRYTVSPGDTDANGIGVTASVDLNSGSLTDLAGNAVSPLSFTAPNTALVNVDTNAASVASIALPANQVHQTAANLDFSVTFSRPVIISGTPRIQINIGGVTKYANFTSDTSGSIKLFRYTVLAGDEDLDGIEMTSPIQTNGGSIRDSSSIDADLAYTLPDTTGILVDGIDLAINSVTLPADGSYILNQNMDFTVNYNYPANVTGSPRIALTVGASPKYATYQSGSGTTALIFRYTVGAGDEDTDGVSVTSNVDLNSGSIQDNFTDNADLTFSGGDYAGKLVDGIVPTISSVTGPAASTYYEDGNLDFVVSTSEAITVTGTPQIQLTIGAATKYAVYVSGNGTNSLTFRYTVVSGDVDADGIANASPIQLNSGSLKDAAGNDLTLTFTTPDTSGVIVDAQAATIASVSTPANATYKTSNNLDFTVNFSRPVFVTNTPRIALTVGATTLYANYLSGHGTSSLIFRYTIQAGEKDLNGIAMTSPIELNSGSIRDSANTSADLNFTVPNTAGILVDGIDLVISSITPPADANYLLNQNLDFTVTFNAPAMITGSPRITLNVGGATKYAGYQSGSGTNSIVFRYTVAAADADADGIDTVGPNLDLNSGTIKDEFNDDASSLAFTQANYANVKVDGAVPTISSVTGPASATYHQNDNVDFTVTLSEAVDVTGSPRIQLTVGAATKYAVYTSGSGTNTLTFRYTVAFGDIDADGLASISPLQLNSGVIEDLAGNDLSVLTFTPPNTPGVIIDGAGAYVTTIVPPAGATYKTSGNVDFVVNFSQNVDVTGTPRIALTLTSGTVYADYLSGSGTSALTFRYVVAAGHIDADGLVMTSPIALNGGTVEDAANNAASLTFTVPDTSAVLVDGIDAAIASITAPANGTYIAAQNIDFVVNFTYPVTITNTPRIQLTVGAATLYANYSSGSGTTAITFRYTVGTGHLDADGITTVGPSILLNGGFIQDQFGDNATRTFTGTNYPNVRVDAVLPTISSVTAPANNTYTTSTNADFIVNFSESVTLTGGTPRLTLTVGAATRYATYLSGAGTAAWTFRYTPTIGDLDTNGIAMTSALDPNGSTISDIATNNMTNFALTPPVLTGILVDAVVPTITSITPPASQTYGLATNLNFTVNFSESVTVTGTPSLSLNIGGASKSATYVSGSGSSALVFRYTVVVNDYDSNGVDTTSPLVITSASIKDASNNDAVLTFTGTNYPGVLVDALPPAVSSVTIPPAATYKPTNILEFSVTFNKNVTVNTAGGTPSVDLTIGANTRKANYTSGSGTAILVFQYTLVVGDDDYDSISANTTLQLNGGTIRDALGNNASLALGTLNTAGIFTIPTELTYWFDLSNTTTVGTSGPSLTQFSSISGALSGTITGAPDYAATGFNTQSSGYFTMTNTQYVSLSSQTVKYFIAVYKAPNGGSGKSLILSTGGGGPATRARVRFDTGGVLHFGTGCASSCKVYNGGGSWTTANGSGNHTTYGWTSNQYRMIVVDFNGSSLANPKIGDAYDGELAEVFIFTGTTAVADSVIDSIGTYLNTKHGTGY